MVSQKSVLILKNAVDVIVTGLKRVIGSPEDYAQNATSGTFPTHFDLRIPTEESE